MTNLNKNKIRNEINKGTLIQLKILDEKDEATFEY